MADSFDAMMAMFADMRLAADPMTLLWSITNVFQRAGGRDERGWDDSERAWKRGQRGQDGWQGKREGWNGC